MPTVADVKPLDEILAAVTLGAPQKTSGWSDFWSGVTNRIDKMIYIKKSSWLFPADR